MKTTIDIADGLLRQAKRLAAERGTTLKAIIEDALRDALPATGKPRGKSRLKLHTFQGQGLQPGLSWDDWSSIQATSYDRRGG